MLSKIWVVSALSAVAMCAPTLNSNAVQVPADMEVLSDYFNLLASKIQNGRNMAAAPGCDLSKAVMPVDSPTALPPPSAGLTLKHVAIGRGTQNYTCGTNATAAPTQVGALATLFNASCVAAGYSDVLATLPKVALVFNLTDVNQKTLAASNLVISGHHYFTNPTTPFFNLDTAAMTLGEGNFSKNNTSPAPAGSVVGQNNVGYGAVPWLKLITKAGSTGNLQEVYRLNTAGGAAPATCAGITGTTFEIQYSAEYWFWAGNP